MTDAASIDADAIVIDGLQCYDFDRLLLDEALRGGITAINHAAVLCDLSYVGEVIAVDAIDHSTLPCAITHCLPRALKNVLCNKSNALFKRCADKGGVIGVSLFAPGLAGGNDATAADVVDAIAYMIELVGDDHVAIGTDFSLNRPQPGLWQEWAAEGTARLLTGFATATTGKPNPLSDNVRGYDGGQSALSSFRHAGSVAVATRGT